MRIFVLSLLVTIFIFSLEYLNNEWFNGRLLIDSPLTLYALFLFFTLLSLFSLYEIVWATLDTLDLIEPGDLGSALAWLEQHF